MADDKQKQVDKLKALQERVKDPKIKQSIDEKIKQADKPINK